MKKIKEKKKECIKDQDKDEIYGNKKWYHDIYTNIKIKSWKMMRFEKLSFWNYFQVVIFFSQYDEIDIYIMIIMLYEWNIFKIW